MSGSIFRQVDIGLYSVSSTKDNVAVVRRAEERGFRRVWLAESFHGRDLIVQATAAATATENIEIALGIMNPYNRHPAQIAMAVADLEELAGPRVTLGLGAAWSSLLMHGVENPRPISALREAGEICRALLRGERLAYEGKIFRFPAPGVFIDFPLARRGVPLYYGTLGPRTLNIASSTADGIILSIFCCPAFIRSAMEHVRTGAAKAGRSTDEMDIADYIIFSVDEDGDAARRAVKHLVAHYVMRVADTFRYEAAGLDPERLVGIQKDLLEAERQNRLADAIDRVPNDIVGALTVAGSPEECVEGLKAYADTGLKTPILYQTLGPDRLRSIDLIAERVLPEVL